MEQALASETNPLDANMERVLPGLFRWHTAQNSKIERIETTLSTVARNLDYGFKDVLKQTREDREESDKRLAQSFVHIGRSSDVKESLQCI